MGANTFTQIGKGASAREAFADARDTAQYEHGHAGYTGTIAEKQSYVMIPLPEGRDPSDYVEELLDDDDSRICDKWGPAGCIKIKNGEYLFFGWASS